MAASVLLTIGQQPNLISKIIEKAKALKPGQSGNGVMGPVIDAASKTKILGYIDRAEKKGAKILLDGRGWASSQKEGWWVGPTIILHSDKKDEGLHDEVFTSLNQETNFKFSNSL
jgi:malonate-semialdehyde dehydrogenase (acetylating) / methylmalonate-semialdehyde dehydrogenase